MSRKLRRGEHIGEPPGQLNGIRETGPVRISRYRYTAEEHRVDRPETLGEALEDTWGVTWINCDGIPDREQLRALESRFGVHPVVLEDIQSSGQRPKLDDHGSYLFIVFSMLSFDDESGEIREEQVALLLFDSVVVTVQQVPGDVLDPLRRRITTGGGRIRRMGADYMAFALLDVVVDNYYPVLERIDERILRAEEDTIHGDGKLEDIHALRRELIRLRKVIWPLRTVFAALKTAESDLLGEALRPFLLDLHDNGIGVLETFEVLRDHVGAVVELSASRQNTTMNEIMKTLTIVASVFIPLTFIAGIYGMNFVHMPELEWRFGYPGVLGFMAVVAGFMLVLFRRRRWL